jgi:hypothetical protein
VSRAPGPWRRRTRAVLLALVGVLYGLSIPWYRSAAAEPRLVLGLPDWVAVAVGCYAAIACLNALAWLLTDVPDAPDEIDGAGR